MRRTIWGAAALAALGAVASSGRAADMPEAGPDMRILGTPADVLFDVDLGPVGKRFRPEKIRGAQGWVVSLAPKGNTEKAIWPTPATDGTRVFIGGPLQSSEFYAIAAEDGRLSWKRSLTDNGPTPAVVRDEHVYFNTQSCTVYAYDARTGAKKWSRYLANHLESIPAVVEDAIITSRPERHESGDETPALTFVHRRSGRVRSDLTIDAEALGGPVLHGGSAYVSTRSGTLYAVDIANAEISWQQSCGATSSPWVDDSGIYVTTATEIHAFEAKTGRARYADAAITPSAANPNPPKTVTPPVVDTAKLRGSTPEGFWRDGVRPVVAADRLCLAEGRALRFFDPRSGAELAWWELDVEHDILGAPIVTNDTLVIATKGGEIRAVDAIDGEVVWAVNVNTELKSGVIVEDASVFGTTTDGRLFRVETGDLRADGWPMWGGE